MNNPKTQQILNQAVADLSQFAVIIHQAHWYLRDKGFFTWHPRLDQFLDEINEYLDQVAEQLIITGGAPYSTLREFIENTKLQENKGDFGVSLDRHLRGLLDNYRYFSALYEQGIATSGAENDNVTQDLFIRLKADADKKIWMLEAAVGK